MSERKIVAIGLAFWGVVFAVMVGLTIMAHGGCDPPTAVPPPPDTLPLLSSPPPVALPPAGPMACPCPADAPPLACTTSADCVPRGCCAWVSLDPLLTYCVAAPDPRCD